MLKIFRNKRAQNTLEVALLIAAVVGALIAIQVFMKRGVQGKLKASSDSIGEQYDAQRTNAQFFIRSESTTTEISNTKGPAGEKFKTYINEDWTLKTGHEHIEAPQ